MNERYESTRTTYKALFQSQPPSEFWPPTFGVVVETSEGPANHLEFLNEDNLPHDEDISTIITELTLSSNSTGTVGSDDDSLESTEAIGVVEFLNEFALCGCMGSTEPSSRLHLDL